MYSTIRTASVFILLSASASLAAHSEPIAGDVDASGGVDAIDVQLVINEALGISTGIDCDVDYSSAVNAVDVQLVINAALGIAIDGDEDGLCDGAEANLGTLPDVFDTDGDGVGDGQEMLDGTDPLAGVPPDPEDIAPEVDQTVPSDPFESTRFLYEGSPRIQTGVSPGTIEPKRVAVLRGKVTDRAGDPLPGVRITVLDHTEFGQTASRDDGMFDMAVNGGGVLTLNYEHADYLPAQRQVDVPWRDFHWLPEVALVELDSQVTTVDFSEPMQVAQGSEVTDSDGTRQSTLLFPQGAKAAMVLRNGAKKQLGEISVRATEYTVGDGGLEAMPAELPPTSAYTYCVEFSTDEALAAKATKVEFAEPVINYLENFLDFPVGTSIPAGYYDRARGVWVASDSGVVVEVLSEAGGLAELDADGDGLPEDATALEALGVTDTERQRVAELYAPGDTLWRVPIPHFSAWDFNQGTSPPPDATPPSGGDPIPEQPEEDPCEDGGGSTVEVQNQVLREGVSVAGTPFALVYSSSRVPGWRASNTVEVPLSGASLPASVNRIDLEITVAGRLYTETFAALPDQSYTFTWDGLDAYGRALLGTQPVMIRVGFVYDMVYQGTDRFGYNGGGMISSDPGREEIALWREWNGTVGAWDARAQGLGGWTLNVHHAYDATGPLLYHGDGKSRHGEGTISVMTSAAAGPDTPGFGILGFISGVDAGADGSLFVIDGRLWRIDPEGNVELLTFGGYFEPVDVAAAPDGSVYVLNAYASNPQVWHVATDGTVTEVAGDGYGFGGDGGPAIDALFSVPRGIALAPDGTLYIADSANHRVRRVSTEGIITTVAGTTMGYSGDDGLAVEAQLNNPWGVAVGPDGSVYIADTYNRRIRRVGVDGIITTVAGTGAVGSDGDGGPAVDAQLTNPRRLTVSPEGELYIMDNGAHMVRVVDRDGIINRFAGSGDYGTPAEGEAAVNAPLELSLLMDAPGGLALGPDGSLYIAQGGAQPLRKVTPSFPGYTGGQTVLASSDGALLYGFDEAGRHLRTQHALTGTVLYEFAYDGEGRLISVTDADGNETTIQHDGAGNPTSITAPFGQQTALAVNADGYLSSVTNPEGEPYSFTYHSGDGLLATFTNPNGNASEFTYDALGRMTLDEDPVGGYIALARTATEDGYEVTKTTAGGSVTTYEMTRLPTGETQLLNTFPSGTQTETLIGVDGTRTTTYPGGTVVETMLSPDPRWGMQAPFVSYETMTTPGGKAYAMTRTREIILTDDADPLSLETWTETLDINGRVSASTYDAATMTTTALSPGGRQSTLRIDERGLIVETEVPNVDPVQFAYDANGRLSTVAQGTGPGTRTTSFVYGADGFLETLTDPLARTTTFEYDLVGRVTRAVLPGSREVLTSYDPLGNLVSVTPPGRTAHIFGHNAVNRLTAYAPPDVNPGSDTTTYDYNLDRQVTRITLPDGTTIDYDYTEGGSCACGRLSSVTLPRGTTELLYDAAGNLASVTSPDGDIITYGHDGSALTSVTWSGAVAGSVEYDLNDDLRAVSRTINGVDTIGYARDNDNLLTDAGALVLSRDADNGLLTGTTLDLVSDAWTYDAFGDPDGYAARYNSAVIYSVAYTRDALGRITALTETVDASTATYAYTYDTAGRLVQVSKNGTPTDTYTYDSNNNRLSHTGAGTTNGTYDAQDRMTAYGSATYAYTADGRLLSKTESGQTTTYDYDELGNLLGVSLPGGTEITYVVDGAGRRIGREVGGVLSQGFLYSGFLNPVAELDGSSTVVSQFVYGDAGNVPSYMVKGGATYRIVSDHLGSPRVVVNASTGAVAQRMDYDAFGNVTLDTNPGFQPFGFAGGLYDADTGLTRFGARDYEAETGRWTAKDPLLFAGGDGNVYAYVSGDPVNRIDPPGTSGKASLCEAERWLGYGCATNPDTQQDIDDSLNKRYGYGGTNELLDDWLWDYGWDRKHNKYEPDEYEYEDDAIDESLSKVPPNKPDDGSGGDGGGESGGDGDGGGDAGGGGGGGDDAGGDGGGGDSCADAPEDEPECVNCSDMYREHGRYIGPCQISPPCP